MTPCLGKVLAMLVATSNLLALQIIAHRGASGYVPEHTREALVLAHPFSDYVEIDVILTRDQQPIVFHDLILDDTTNIATLSEFQERKEQGHFYVKDFSFAELRTLDVQERRLAGTQQQRFPGRYPGERQAGFRIMHLQEYLQLLRDVNTSRHREVGLVLEIKSPDFHRKHKFDLTSVIYATLEQTGYLEDLSSERLILESFDAFALQKLHQRNPNLALVQLIDLDEEPKHRLMQSLPGLENIRTYAMGIGPSLKYCLNSKKQPTPFIRLAQRLGLKTFPYTLRSDELPEGYPEHKDLVQALVAGKFTAIFTDFPDTTATSLSNLRSKLRI